MELAAVQAERDDRAVELEPAPDRRRVAQAARGPVGDAPVRRPREAEPVVAAGLERAQLRVGGGVSAGEEAEEVLAGQEGDHQRVLRLEGEVGGVRCRRLLRVALHREVDRAGRAVQECDDAGGAVEDGDPAGGARGDADRRGDARRERQRARRGGGAEHDEACGRGGHAVDEVARGGDVERPRARGAGVRERHGAEEPPGGEVVDDDAVRARLADEEAVARVHGDPERPVQRARRRGRRREVAEDPGRRAVHQPHRLGRPRGRERILGGPQDPLDPPLGR